MMPAIFLLALFLQQTQTPCAADIRAMHAPPKLVYRDVPRTAINLFSAVSKGARSCTPAEIRINVSYFDAQDELIWSGVIEAVASQTALTQTTILEMSPWNMVEFVRWRNGPRPAAVRPRRLLCMDPDGLAEIPGTELERAVFIRVYATVLPPEGGIGTTEVSLRLQP